MTKGAHKSQQRRQLSGIAQGCPLSPFLFVMLTTVVMKGATSSRLEQHTKDALLDGDLSVLLYADDTLLVGRCQHRMQQLLGEIAAAGARVGTELHWDKFLM